MNLTFWICALPGLGFEVLFFSRAAVDLLADLLELSGERWGDWVQDEANIKSSYAAPCILEVMLKILTFGAADTLEAVVSEAVAFGLVSEQFKILQSELVAFRAKGIEAVFVALDIADTSFVSVVGIDISVLLLEMDLAALGATELEWADVVVLDMYALMLGRNVRWADLEATALKSVDLLVAAGSVVTWLDVIVTGRQLVCGLLKLRVCFFVWEAGHGTAGAENERLFLGCCPLPLHTGAWE